MQFELRPYQEEAIAAVESALKSHEGIHPVVSLPTGSGKTIVIAKLAYQASLWNQRVLILAHVKELLDQSYRTIQSIEPNGKFGLLSAGLGKRDVDAQILIAGIQSLYPSMKEVLSHGAFDLVIIDEAHMVGYEEKCRYQKVIKAIRKMNSRVRFVGLTATPFRMKTGLITRGNNAIFNKIVYEKSVSSLIDEGYLSPVMSRIVKNEVDTQGLHIKRGEFVAEEVNSLVNKQELIDSACNEIIQKANEYDRKKVLIFASNCSHACNIKATIKNLSGEDCEIILGDTPNKERDKLIDKFRNSTLRYVVNVGVLTTGFDNPKIDLVAIIRPTASPGLYYQMAGRGLRKADGKDHCLLLDFGQNIKRHGPIDDIEVKPARRRKLNTVRHCPKCGLILKKDVTVCPWCKTVVPIIKKKPAKNTKLTYDSSELDPLALRGREFFTEHGLIEIQNIAKAFVCLYREGKFDDMPRNEYGIPDFYIHHDLLGEELDKIDWEYSCFIEENFKLDEFRKNESFRNELYDALSRIEKIALMGTVRSFGRLISCELPLNNDSWKITNENFNSSWDPFGVWNSRDWRFDFVLRIQQKALLIKVVRSYLREIFVSREELDDFMSKPFPDFFFQKRFRDVKRCLEGKFNTTRIKTLRGMQNIYSEECELNSRRPDNPEKYLSFIIT